QKILVADGGDVIDFHLDVVLVAPFLDDRAHRVVGAGYPVVPEAHRELAGRIRGPHVGRGDGRRGRRRRRLQETTPRKLGMSHSGASVSLMIALHGLGAEHSCSGFLCISRSSVSLARGSGIGSRAGPDAPKSLEDTGGP